jgi:hypothetical protein
MLYCPKCRGEFEDWAKTCPDCQVELVAEPPPPPEQPDRFKSLRDRELGQSLRDPKVMLILAGAVTLLAFFAFIFVFVATRIVENAGGWGLSMTLLFHLSAVIYYPGLLLGLAALAIPQWTDSPAGAHRVFRLLVIAAVVLVLLGIGQVVTYAALHLGPTYTYPESGWRMASEVSRMLAGALFSSALLLGLGYLCLRRARAIESPAAPAEVPEP